MTSLNTSRVEEKDKRKAEKHGWGVNIAEVIVEKLEEVAPVVEVAEEKKVIKKGKKG